MKLHSVVALAAVAPVLAAGAVLAPLAGADRSASAADAAAAQQCHSDAPATINDYVANHATAMTRQSCNTDVAVYVDAAAAGLPAGRTTWVDPFMTTVWRHMKATYGACAVPRDLPAPMGPGCERFGEPKPVLMFVHQRDGGYSGTVRNRFDEVSGFRNTVDVFAPGWNESDSRLRDVLVHEACHIVEGAGQGVHESPAFGVWGDSKWAEFCVYDFYARTGRTADAQRVEAEFTANRDSLPAGANGAAWFRDWFLPLWQENGRNGAVMQRFFGLLSQHFPKVSHNGGRNLSYGSRRLNAGEFVHFMSGAAGRDLSARAATAFNSGFNRAQFEEAQRAFPEVTY